MKAFFVKSPNQMTRVQYKSTYDKQLLNDIRVLAQREMLSINDLIEFSVQFISLLDTQDRRV
ncbi:hypothetical protein [Paenisporosarcina indica]|uniref:hypothetical protein n=1 Tax=Paenisporosarcina indica TaxID=650093 RepID=UPI00137249C0|nr:hypothetical protein [Paenisporosarcina indica]